MGDAPRSAEFDDVYFSAADGPGETAHVFLDGNDLPARWQGAGRHTIAETGFGTGLNFLLAWEAFDKTAPAGAFLDFISVEKFPLRAEEIRRGLSPWASRLSPYLDRMLTRYPMRVPGFHRVVFDGRVALTLVFGDANDVLAEIDARVDTWFLDGFTPSKNPDMWTDTVFTEMARLSHAGTTFATFTAAGFVKRGLQAAGFHVEKRKGFGPKRDMLAGRYGGAGTIITVPLQTPRIMIHGAGLAGCATAYALSQYGLKSTIYDPSGVATGASGNPLGLINPRFTAFRTPDSDFYASGFALTAREMPLLSGVGYNPCGSVHLVTDEEKEKRFLRTVEHWGWQDGEMQYLNPALASDAAGAALGFPALYLSSSAQISPAALCGAYVERAGAVLSNRELEADVHIYATGPGSARNPMLANLPVHTVRGQISLASATAESTALKTNICYGGYVSAPSGGMHVIGSTFQKWLTETEPRREDDADNLAKLAAHVPMLSGLRASGARAALRTASRDRFPVIGRIDDGLFVTTAHGSHGILSSLAGAHLLADFIRGGPASLGKKTVKALSPARFTVRETRMNPEFPKKNS